MCWPVQGRRTPGSITKPLEAASHSSASDWAACYLLGIFSLPLKWSVAYGCELLGAEKPACHMLSQEAVTQVSVSMQSHSLPQ